MLEERAESMSEESQMEAVSEVIDAHIERTEQLMASSEKKVEGACSGGEQSSVKPPFVFKSVDHMKPDTLVKDVRPSELRAWIIKYNTWFRCSFQGNPTLELEVDSFLSVLNSWRTNSRESGRGPHLRTC